MGRSNGSRAKGYYSLKGDKSKSNVRSEPIKSLSFKWPFSNVCHRVEENLRFSGCGDSITDMKKSDGLR